MLLCSNVVKFVRREIGEIVRYLPHKKNKISAATETVAMDRAQNLPRQAHNVLTLFQISSKSIHFRRSYSRTHQRRFFAP